jgi:predicted MFS family arabinose efflux permease
MLYSLSLRQEKLLTFLLSALQFTHAVDYVIMMPLGPQFMHLFGIGPSEFGLMVSVYNFSACLSGIVASLFMDRYDRKKALLFLYAGFAASTFLCGMASDHYFFVLARMMAGAFGGIISGMVFSIVGDVIPESRRGLATGRVMAAFALASIIGVPLGLKIAQSWSWRAPFFALGALSLLLLLVAHLLLPQMTKHLQKALAHGRFEQTFRILTRSNHIRAYALSSCLMAGAFLVIPFISPSLVANTHYKEENLFYIYLVGGAFTFFTSPLIGRLADHLGKLRMFIIMAIISVIPIFLITHLGASPLWMVLAATTFFMICSSGRMVPATALITSSATPDERGGFMSINSSIQQFSAGLATFVAGQIISKSSTGEFLHYDWVGYLSIVLTFLALALAPRVRQDLKDRRFSQDLESHPDQKFS